MGYSKILQPEIKKREKVIAALFQTAIFVISVYERRLPSGGSSRGRKILNREQ